MSKEKHVKRIKVKQEHHKEVDGTIKQLEIDPNLYTGFGNAKEGWAILLMPQIDGPMTIFDSPPILLRTEDEGTDWHNAHESDIREVLHCISDKYSFHRVHTAIIKVSIH